MDTDSAPKGKLKILIVDDEPAMRLLIRTALESLPADLAEAVEH